MANKRQLKEHVLPILDKYKCTANRCISVNAKFQDKKMKNASLLITNLGLFFLKKTSILKNLKEWNFISYLDMTEFEFINETRIICKYKSNHKCLIEYSNISEIIDICLTSYLSLYYHSPKFKPLIFSGFPTNYDQSFPESPIPNLLSIRYLAQCIRFGNRYCDSTLMIFEEFEKTTKYSIFLNDKCLSPNNYRIISFPLIHLQIQAIRFSGYSPYITMKILLKIMKYNKNLKAVSFQNYSFLYFNKFHFKDCFMPSVMSWNFSKLNINDKLFEEFISSFEFYRGEIQQLTLSNMQLSKKLSINICNKIKNIHCMKTIEELILDKININNNDSSSIEIYEIFLNTFQRFLSFHRLVVTSWEQTINIETKHKCFLLDKMTSIKQIVFSKFNLNNIHENINFPSNMINFEFNECMFTSTSLFLILQSLTNHPNKFVLSLNNININEWSKFYLQSKNLTTLTKLIEFDWSGNPIPNDFISTFLNIFINRDIKFLSISDCFTKQQIPQLKQFLIELSKTKIWGLEIKGWKPETTFKTMIIDILPELGMIKTLEHLNLSNHQFTRTAAHSVVKTMESLKISELIIDDV